MIPSVGMDDILPIDLAVRDRLKVPGDPRQIHPADVSIYVNGHRVRGVQRLVVRDDKPDKRVVELHIHPTLGNHPVDGATSNVHVTVQLNFSADEPYGTIELIGGDVSHGEHEGRDVWTITGQPA